MTEVLAHVVVSVSVVGEGVGVTADCLTQPTPGLRLIHRPVIVRARTTQSHMHFVSGIVLQSSGWGWGGSQMKSGKFYKDR